MKSSPVVMKVIFIFILALTFIFPINAFAKRPYYVAFKPGIYSPQSNDLDSLDTGFSGEVSLGYRFNPHIAAEVGIGFLYTEGNKRINGETYDREFDISVLPITFTLKAILPYKNWEFYGLAGGGIYIVSIPYDEDYDYHDYHDNHHDYDDDYHYDTRLGGYLGAGITYNINPKIFIGVEGKYLWTDKVKVEYKDYGAHRDLEFRLNGVIATAVIGFRF